MIQLSYLTAQNQAIVDAKLAEIEERSGSAWACELSQQQQLNDRGYLLEVTVNGRFLQPVSLGADTSANHICAELERLEQTFP